MELYDGAGRLEAQGWRISKLNDGLWEFYGATGIKEVTALYDVGICRWRVDYASGDTARVVWFYDGRIIANLEWNSPDGGLSLFPVLETVIGNDERMKIDMMEVVLPDLSDFDIQWIAGTVSRDFCKRAFDDVIQRGMLDHFAEVPVVQTDSVYRMRIPLRNVECDTIWVSGMVYWSRNRHDNGTPLVVHFP